MLGSRWSRAGAEASLGPDQLRGPVRYSSPLRVEGPVWKKEVSVSALPTPQSRNKPESAL